MLKSQHWSVLLFFKCFSAHFIEFYFYLFIFRNTIVCISCFFFWLLLSFLPKPSLFLPSVPPHSLFSLKHKWMHGHLGWESQGHTLEASHITLPCVIAAGFVLAPATWRGWVRAWEKCVCGFFCASSRSAIAGLQQIQFNFGIKYNIERPQVVFCMDCMDYCTLKYISTK